MSDIKSFKVTKSVTYTPSEYIYWCEEQGDIPTQEGFKEFISGWIYEDFGDDILDIEEV